MKKWVVLLSLVILATITYTAWSEESEFYVKTVNIYKIYHHNKGFRIVYEKQDMQLTDVFIPYSWFRVPDKPAEEWKAEVIYGDMPEYPYMNIYWKGGQFSHIRLFLKAKKTHPSWGTLRDPDSFNNSFDIESPDFDF